MVDYSKWEHIEISDDEDDVQPFINKSALFELRHTARLERSAEMDRRKDVLKKRKHAYQVSLAHINDLMKANEGDAEVKSALEDMEKEGKAIEAEEQEIAKLEQKQPLNVDTISKPGFQKTGINKKNTEPKADLTEAERELRMEKFMAEKEEVCRKYGTLTSFEHSKAFLEQHMDLVCEDTVDYLTMWCLSLEMEGKYDLLETVVKQCMCMRYILDAGKNMGFDPRCYVPIYFSKLLESDDDYRQQFAKDIQLFKQNVKEKSDEKIKEAVSKRIEDESKQIEEERKRMAAVQQPTEPLTTDDIGQMGFQNPIMNRSPENREHLTGAERLAFMEKFLEQSEEVCVQFGKLEKFEDSEAYLEEHRDLICEQTCNYLTYWCISLQTRGEHEAMKRAAHQCLVMRYILGKAKHLKLDPHGYFPVFFRIMLDHECECYQQFQCDVEAFELRIRERAEMKIQQAIAQDEILTLIEQQGDLLLNGRFFSYD